MITNTVPNDYKFFMFNGKMDSVMVCTNRASGHPTFRFYDKEWNRLLYQKPELEPESNVERPENYEKMIRIAEQLSENLVHMRVDLYNIDRRIKKIIIPYIIWSFIFAVVNRRINTFIPDVFMSKCNGIYYFILVYIQMVLLIPVTFKLLRSRFSKLGWFVTPVSIFLIRYISLWFNLELGFPFQGELFVFWFGFYYLGVSLKNGYINLQLSKKCLTNLCLFSLVIQGVEGFIWYWMGNFDMATTQLKMSSIITTGLFCIRAYIYIEAGDLNLNEQPVILKKFLKVLGDNSFGIYLCHMLIIRILNKLVPMANVFPINAIFVIMISTVCVMMAHRILGKYAYVIGV